MNTPIQSIAKADNIWSDLNQIKQLFAPNLSDKEFSFFVSLGVRLQANPFTREIWAIKYDESKPASIFLARDFYRKKAQEQPDYNGHTADAVYSNDQFDVKDGIPSHSYTLKDRGQLIGAYATVTRKTISKPFFVFCELKEYDKGFSLWKNMKAMLIKKVAEAQCLRMAYQGIFAETHSEDEAVVIMGDPKELPSTQQPQPEPQPKAPETNGDIRPITAGQVKLLYAQTGKSKNKDTIIAGLKGEYGIEHLEQLPAGEMNNALNYIKDKIEELG